MKRIYIFLSLAFLFAFTNGLKASSKPGLSYKYYEGSWLTLPDFNTLSPIKSGISPNVDPGVSNSSTNYAILWEGFIFIKDGGTYTFETSSDDGSKLYISPYSYATTALVDNDGEHSIETKQGSLYLTPGLHPISISFLQACCEGSITVKWKHESASTLTVIPDSVLRHYVPETINTLSPGLDYSYFEGIWNSLPDFKTMTPKKIGFSTTLDLAIRDRADNYGILWKGFITIPDSGTYTFDVKADDGTKVFLGPTINPGTPLINNDGLHDSLTAVAGTIYLRAGAYPILITYFQASLDAGISVYWSSSKIPRQPIPKEAYSRYSTDTVSRFSPGLDYSYYEGTWSRLPEFSGLTPAKAGISSNVSLGVRQRDNFYSLLWKGYITVPADGTYIFETNSDDGSRIYIANYSADAAPLVENDGEHGFLRASDTLYLAAGVYPVAISYLQANSLGTLEAYWSSNAGLSKQRIPDNAFSHLEKDGLVGSSATYYFSSSLGNDSYSTNSRSTPWRSLHKVDSVLANATSGTTILLKRGDVFTGSIHYLSPGASGTASDRIVISAYDAGHKPIINGLSSSITSGWSYNSSLKIWQSTLDTTLNKKLEEINMLLFEGKNQPIGRYPNITQPNRGYLQIQSHNGNSSITDANFPSGNWVGADLVIRKNNWVFDRGKIISVSGSTVAYDNTRKGSDGAVSSFQPNDNFGYFIQNSINTLDQEGEWFFDRTNKVMSIYSTDASHSPDQLGFAVTMVDTLITITGRNYLTLDNLSLQGTNKKAIAIWDNSNITIQNCTIDYSGLDAISGNYSSNFVLSNNTINHTNNVAFWQVPNSHNTILKNNTIKNTGLTAGMGANGHRALEGIILDGNGSLIQYNTIDSAGYLGMTFSGNNSISKNNFVNHFAMTGDDGGGIYVADANSSGRKIVGNIVLNGIGAFEGTGSHESNEANGISTDDNSSDVQIIGNTVANNNGRGFGLHNSQYISARNNTLFNNKKAQIEFDHDPAITNPPPTRYDTVINNIVFSNTPNQPLFWINTEDDDVSASGIIDSNYYHRRVSNELAFTTQIKNLPKTNTVFSLSHWKLNYGFDSHSTDYPDHVPTYVINSTGSNIYTNGRFANDINKVHSANGNTAIAYYSNSPLDTGALKVTYQSTDPSTYNAIWFYDTQNPSANPQLQAGHTYRVRFSAVSTKNNKVTFDLRLQREGDDYIDTSTNMEKTEAVHFTIDSIRKEIELLITPQKNINKGFVSMECDNMSEAQGGIAQYYIDNFVFEDVTSITYNEPDEYVKFVYNADSSATTMPLDEEYKDIKGNTYSYYITLAPYSSAVLMKSAKLTLYATMQESKVAAVMALIPEKTNAGNLRISPNPATSRIKLNYTPVRGQNAAILNIYNNNGILVKTVAVTLGGEPIDVDISSLTPGIYTIILNSGIKKETQKFVKF